MKTLHVWLTSILCSTMVFMLVSCAATPYFSVYRPNDITVQNMSVEQAIEVLTKNASKMQIATKGDQQWSEVTGIHATTDKITVTNGRGVSIDIILRDISEISAHGNLVSLLGTSTFLYKYTTMSADEDNMTLSESIANALYVLTHNKKKGTV